MADEPSCAGLDLPVVGCIGTGYPGFDAYLAVMSGLAVLSFGLWMKLLEGETWRVRVGLWLLDARWSTAYAKLLHKLLVRLRWFFGRPLGFRAVDRSFRIAVLYALVAVGFAQVFANEHIPLSFFLIAMPFYLGAIWLFFRIGRWISTAHNARRRDTGALARKFWFHLREQATYIGLALALVFVYYAALMGAYLVLGDPDFASPTTLAQVQAFFAGPAGALIFGVANTVMAGAMVGLLLGAGLNAIAYMALAILGGTWNLILVFLNTAFDWPSWAISRWLMGRLEADAMKPVLAHRIGALVLHLVLDFLLSIACLFGIAIVLVLFDGLLRSITELPGDFIYWRHFFHAAGEDPFSLEGIVITLMLVSTLVPTTLHLIFAVFSLAAVKPPYRAQMTEWLDDHSGGKEWGNRAMVSAYLTFWILFAISVVLGAVVLLMGGLDWLWVALGWGRAEDAYPFWSSIFRAAEMFVIF